MDKVSVILCCYNQQEYIEQALRSIIFQKIGCLVELIIADDCSPDATLSIIKDIERQGHKSNYVFKYLNSENNIGFHANYRRAFAACTGKYTAILEGDDWWDKPNHLQQHIDFLESHHRCSMSFNRINVFNQNSGEFNLQRWPTKDRKLSLKQHIQYGNPIGNLSACVFRTKYLKSLPEEFFDLNFADYELGMFMALHGPIGALGESSSVYRISDNGQWQGLSSEERQKRFIDDLKAVSDHLPKRARCYISEYLMLISEGRQNEVYLSWKGRIKRLLRKWKK